MAATSDGDNISSTMAAATPVSIKAIDTTSIHRICSGQVIVDLGNSPLPLSVSSSHRHAMLLTSLHFTTSTTPISFVLLFFRDCVATAVKELVENSLDAGMFERSNVAMAPL
jgi:hypothetical protein